MSPSAMFVLVVVFFSASFHGLLAFDPSPLQDFCVADLSTPVRTNNGFFCKDPATLTANDFVFKGILTPRPPTVSIGSNVTVVNVENFPALNTQGVSLERIDYAPYGINPPHIHPRGSEVITVLKGTLYAGFVTSPPENRLFAKVLKKGDVMIFPFAQIHFQMNLEAKPAVAFSALSGQLPGVVRLADSVFGSVPPIIDDLLARSFRIDKKLVNRLQRSFGPRRSN